MEDVIQVENQFYVLATSSLADDRTRVLKCGETFAVLNRLGDVEALGLGEQGIASQEHAGRLAATLLREDIFCGWGIRTLGSGEVRYNPMSYHNGSVWPQYNAIIASGLARYGFKKEALRVLNGLFEASTFMELNRLPELFCGFHKRSDLEGPTLYPVACSPQAWAAAGAYLLLEACMGITIQPAERMVEFVAPQLPDLVDWVELTNLRVGKCLVDLRLRRDGDEIKVDVLRTDDDVTIRVRK